MGNIGYDTKKNSEGILGRWRQLLSAIWTKFVPVAPKYLEFRFGVKKFALELPKVPDLAKYVKKNAKKCFIALATWIPRIRRIKFLHWICLLFWPNFGEVWLKKKTLKIEIKLFIDIHFQLPNNFCFSYYVTDTLISVQLWAVPFNSFVKFLGRESPHTLQFSYLPILIPSNSHNLQFSYPPTSFYQ